MRWWVPSSQDCLQSHQLPLTKSCWSPKRTCDQGTQSLEKEQLQLASKLRQLEGGRHEASVEFGSLLTWWFFACHFAYCALCLARIKQLGQDMQAWSAVDCWRAYAKIRNQAEVLFRSSLEICGFSLLSYPKLKLDFSRPLARPAFCVQNVSSFRS